VYAMVFSCVVPSQFVLPHGCDLGCVGGYRLDCPRQGTKRWGLVWDWTGHCLASVLMLCLPSWGP
jgi:hypothetical protein